MLCYVCLLFCFLQCSQAEADESGDDAQAAEAPCDPARRAEAQTPDTLSSIVICFSAVSLSIPLQHTLPLYDPLTTWPTHQDPLPTSRCKSSSSCSVSAIEPAPYRGCVPAVHGCLPFELVLTFCVQCRRGRRRKVIGCPAICMFPLYHKIFECFSRLSLLGFERIPGEQGAYHRRCIPDSKM